MAFNDAATTVTRATELDEADADRLPVGFGLSSGTVVAGPPDDAREMARLEVLRRALRCPDARGHVT